MDRESLSEEEQQGSVNGSVKEEGSSDKEPKKEPTLSGSRKKAAGSAKKSDALSLVEAGKGLGLSGIELREFVKEQQDIEREWRQYVREEKRMEAEAEERRLAAEEKRMEAEAVGRRLHLEAVAEERRLASEERRREMELNHEIELQRLKMEGYVAQRKGLGCLSSSADSDVDGRYHPQKLQIPKFENRQLANIAKYLDVFESVVKQNGYNKEMWPLSLRTAVTGSKLEEIVKLGGSYEEIKGEILLAYGQTAEKLWKELTSIKQGEESFRQFCLRVLRRLEQFSRLAVSEKCEFIPTLVKYLVLESCPTEMRTFLIERKMSALSLDDFQDIGVAYQEAHGRPGKNQDRGRKYTQQDASMSSTQVWKVSVEELISQLESMPLDLKSAFRL